MPYRQLHATVGAFSPLSRQPEFGVATPQLSLAPVNRWDEKVDPRSRMALS
jgi:hypothetical protein